MRRSTAAGARRQDAEQLDLEHEHRIGRDHPPGPGLAIAELRRHIEDPFVAGAHQGQRLLPCGHQVREAHHRRHAPLHGAVEHRPVGEGAHIVHLHLVRRAGMRPRGSPGGQDLVLQAGGQDLHSVGLGIAGEEAFRGGRAGGSPRLGRRAGLSLAGGECNGRGHGQDGKAPGETGRGDGFLPKEEVFYLTAALITILNVLALLLIKTVEKIPANGLGFLYRTFQEKGADVVKKMLVNWLHLFPALINTFLILVLRTLLLLNDERTFDQDFSYVPLVGLSFFLIWLIYLPFRLLSIEKFKEEG